MSITTNNKKSLSLLSNTGLKITNEAVNFKKDKRQEAIFQTELRIIKLTCNSKSNASKHFPIYIKIETEYLFAYSKLQNRVLSRIKNLNISIIDEEDIEETNEISEFPLELNSIDKENYDMISGHYRWLIPLIFQYRVGLMPNDENDIESIDDHESSTEVEIFKGIIKHFLLWISIKGDKVRINVLNVSDNALSFPSLDSDQPKEIEFNLMSNDKIEKALNEFFIYVGKNYLLGKSIEIGVKGGIAIIKAIGRLFKKK